MGGGEEIRDRVGSGQQLFTCQPDWDQTGRKEGKWESVVQDALSPCWVYKQSESVMAWQRGQDAVRGCSGPEEEEDGDQWYPASPANRPLSSGSPRAVHRVQDSSIDNPVKGQGRAGGTFGDLMRNGSMRMRKAQYIQVWKDGGFEWKTERSMQCRREMQLDTMCYVKSSQCDTSRQYCVQWERLVRVHWRETGMQARCARQRTRGEEMRASARVCVNAGGGYS